MTASRAEASRLVLNKFMVFCLLINEVYRAFEV